MEIKQVNEYTWKVVNDDNIHLGTISKWCDTETTELFQNLMWEQTERMVLSTENIKQIAEFMTNIEIQFNKEVLEKYKKNNIFY